MWIIEQLDPGQGVYNITRCFRIFGPLDVDALERSLREILRRHEALRVALHNANGTPRLSIRDAEGFSLPFADLTHLPEGKRAAKAEASALEDARRPFNLEKDFFLRPRLYRIGSREHIFLLNTHHIAWDAWSTTVFWNELQTLYDAIRAGKVLSLPPLRMQYSDFAAWQRREMQGERLDELLRYWRGRLAGAPPLELPARQPRPAWQSTRGATMDFTIPGSLLARMNEFARTEHATLYMVLFGGYNLWLQRLSGRNDLVVGTAVAGRDRAEVETLIGFFVNTLAVRTRIEGNPTFREVVRNVRGNLLEAFEHQQLPFDQLVAELRLPRDLSRSPLFQTALVLHNTPPPQPSLAGLEVTEIALPGVVTHFDLTITLVERAGELHGRCEYSTELFDVESIREWLGQYVELLESFVDAPDRRIGATSAPAPTPEVDPHEPVAVGLHQLFESEVVKSPDREAVVYEDLTLTYGQLNQRADRLAGRLTPHVPDSDAVIAVWASRSADAIVAMIATLKAGAAFLPLDPDTPAERVAFLLRDAGVAAVVSESNLLVQLPGNDTPAIMLDQFAWEQEAPMVRRRTARPEDLAYVVYTSGSTGRPKGVAIEHRNIVNYLSGIVGRFGFEPGMSHAVVSTLAADLGYTVVFGALITGGCLHVISRDRSTSVPDLADYFRKHPIDVLKTTPSHLRALRNGRDFRDILPRKLLILGGEASGIDFVQQLRALAPDCAIHNHYGPTETAVGVTTFPVGPFEGGPSGPLPLGRPLPNVRCHVLDEHIQPVPDGEPGELCIAGPSVARGYLNDSRQTAEKFVSNPFSRREGARLYRTGDRVRVMPDGNLEFLGRIDDQIKVRGHRVEPREIEAVLRAESGISDAAVVPQEDPIGGARLVAYVVPEEPAAAADNLYQLPNGLRVAHLNRNETDYIYHEIFELQAYLRHGITVRDGDCIVDAGANIGLFTVCAHLLARNLHVFAFEPNPVIFPLLETNARIHGDNVRCFPFGLSAAAGNAELTFFEGMSLLSGYHPDPEKEQSVVRKYALNKLGPDGASREVAAAIDELLADRFATRSTTTALRTLSEVMADENIEQIDLLKINAEKSELEILRGIEPEDWSRIRQIVIEVDEKAGLEPIMELLDRYGFEAVAEQDPLLRETELCYVYAVRPSRDHRLIRHQAPRAHVRALGPTPSRTLTPQSIRSRLRSRLPEYMVPQTITILPSLPLSANGKIDRTALPPPTVASEPKPAQPPRNRREEILLPIWRRMLRRDDLGVEDNFFDVGGDSILAIQISNRAREVGLAISPRQFFEYQTVARMAAVAREISVAGDGVPTDSAAIRRHGGRAGGATTLSEAPSSPGRDLSRRTSSEARDPLTSEANTCLHGLFDAAARETPEATAVLQGPVALSYRQVQERSNALAALLCQKGIAADAPVAVMVSRSPNMVITLLGILKAGGAYVPIDPSAPRSRIGWQLGDSGARIVLSETSVSGAIPSGNFEVVLVDTLDLAEPSVDKLRLPTVSSRQLAYIIYTSGSTGKPKGVLIEHRSAGAYIQDYMRRYELGPRDRVLQFASLSFDTSVEEIFATLASGATLVLQTPHMPGSAASFCDTCRRFGITILSLPTAYWHAMTSEMIVAGLSLPKTIRLTIIGGERAESASLRRWQQVVGDSVKLINAYGPTETTIAVTHADLTRHDPGDGDPPIGLPVANNRIHLLDANRRPIAMGESGEIWVAGVQVARGYHRNPDLTAERFIPDPFGNNGERMYRTGDLGRFRPDGQLEFSGRIDEQVKIRGYRIEPAEIASVLARHPAVTQAVVMADMNHGAGIRLIAHVVPAATITPRELREYAEQELSDYMVPAEFIMVQEIPLTHSGKVDRERLRSMGKSPDLPATRRPASPPTSPLERNVAEIWQGLLGVDSVGRHDNFFELGGHSLLAMQAVSRIHSRCGAALSLRDFFAAPTVAGLTASIAAATAPRDPTSAETDECVI